MHRILALIGVAVSALIAPAAAQAGSYHVYTCVAGGGVYANGAWKATAQPGAAVDSSCAGNTIALTAGAGARMANNVSAMLTFTSPPQTTIQDFVLTRQIGYTNPVADGTHRYFVLYSLGATHFAGAGNFANPTRDALNVSKHWYGYPEADVAVAKSTVSRASFPALASYTGTANTLTLRLGCFDRGTPCSVAAGGGISHILHGSDVTISDPTPPAVAVEASGLLAGGPRDGSDPITLTATDNSGIRKVEVLDATDTTAPQVVGVEDYGRDRTDANKACDYSLPAPCPALAGETIRATALPAGVRSVIVRVTDTGGNVTQRGPYQVFAVTASDRGAPNGANATETATLQAVFTKTGKSARRTVGYRTRAGVRGRLVNSAGQPIAGATVVLLTRDLRQGAQLVQRGTLTTAADGTFRTTVTASASRLLQFGWLSHANDIRFAGNAYLTLQARASSSLRVSTRRPRVGRRLTISGRLRGVSRGGVPVLVQGRAKGAKRYETFADTTTSASGRFRVSYRFRDAGSRGRSFVFRARIRPAVRFPYKTGYSQTVTVRVR